MESFGCHADGDNGGSTSSVNKSVKAKKKPLKKTSRKKNLRKKKDVKKTNDQVVTTLNEIKKNADVRKQLFKNQNLEETDNKFSTLKDEAFESLKNPKENLNFNSKDKILKKKSTAESSNLNLKTNTIKERNTRSKTSKYLKNSEKLVNVDCPLQVLSQPPTSLLADQNQMRLAVEEYSMNHGIVGLSYHLKDSSGKGKYTAQQLDNASQNIRNLNASFELSANKFFKNNNSNEMVYEIQNITKDCTKTTLTRFTRISNITSSPAQNFSPPSAEIQKESLKQINYGELSQNRSDSFLKIVATEPIEYSNKNSDSESDTCKIILSDESSFNEKTIDTKNLPSPGSSQILLNTATSLTPYTVNAPEMMPNYLTSIKKDWLLKKFFKDVRLCSEKLEGQQGEEKENKHSISINNNVEGCSSIDSYSSNECIRHYDNHNQHIDISTIPNKFHIKSSASSQNEEIECNNRLNQPVLKSTVSIKPASVLSFNSYDLNKTDLTLINSEVNNNNVMIENNSMEIVKREPCTINMENRNSESSHEMCITPTSNIAKAVGNDNQTIEKSYLLKRKITEDHCKLESIVMKQIRLSEAMFDNTEDIIQKCNIEISDLLNIYKGSLTAKANEINKKFEKMISMEKFENIQEKIEKDLHKIENLKKSLEINMVNIDELKLKLRKKETEQKQLIQERNEAFKNIRNSFLEINDFYETNKDKFELAYANCKNELHKCSKIIRNKLWRGHLDQVINSFAENMGPHYNFDDSEEETI